MGLIPMVSLCTCQRTVSLISCPFATISNHRILYKTLSLLTLHLHILDCSRWASSICDHPFIHRQISGQVSRDARQRPLRGTSKTSPTNVEESWLFPPVLLFPINIARSMSLTLSRPFTIEPTIHPLHVNRLHTTIYMRSICEQTPHLEDKFWEVSPKKDDPLLPTLSRATISTGHLREYIPVSGVSNESG